MFLYDVMSLVTIFSNQKTTLCHVLYQQKKLTGQQKYAVSAKTCWVIKMPDDDSAKVSWVSKNLLSQQKSADSAKYAVSTKFD